MTDGPCLDDHAGLRPYLIAMRGGLVNWLVRDGIEDSTLALLADVGAAIGACGPAAEPPADMVAMAETAPTSLGSGSVIAAPSSDSTARPGAIALDSVRAVGLAARLIAAALPRLDAP
jgi:hypothetical protein